MRLGLDRMDDVRKLHRVLDEEHRDVVADEVPVAFVGVELDREAAHVARGIGRAALAGNGGEADEHRRALAGLGEDRRARQLRQRLVAFEIAVRARSARMHDALGNALVIEVRDLLAQDEIFEQRRTAQTRLERILVVRDRHARLVVSARPPESTRTRSSGPLAGLKLICGLPLPTFSRRVGLGERAAADHRMRRLDSLAGCVGSRAASPNSDGFAALYGNAAATASVPATLAVAASVTQQRRLCGSDRLRWSARTSRSP